MRVPCQVCGRALVPLKDGRARNHVPRRGSEDYCQGSGYRLPRWSVGQRLRHHGGSVWEIIEDLDGKWGDYLIRCVIGSASFKEGWLEPPGKEMIAHGEYLHRDGWTPVEAGRMSLLFDLLAVLIFVAVVFGLAVKGLDTDS